MFVVSEGSEATFSVGEVLAGVSIPNYEAVMHTTGLSGEVRLDGGASLVTVNLHSMTSDEPFRDRYVQSRMFPGQPTASVSFGNLTPLPGGFTNGDPVTTEVSGTLNINDMDVPLTFAIEARDDGDTVFVLGRLHVSPGTRSASRCRQPAASSASRTRSASRCCSRSRRRPADAANLSFRAERSGVEESLRDAGPGKRLPRDASAPPPAALSMTTTKSALHRGAP